MMILCVGSTGAGKTLMLRLVRSKNDTYSCRNNDKVRSHTLVTYSHAIASVLFEIVFFIGIWIERKLMEV